MKQIFLLTLSLLLVFTLSAQQSAKRYAVKSGKVEYELTGNTTGTKTVYFDDYGDKYYEQIKSVSITKIFGVTDRSETNKVTIINKSHFWTMNKIDGKNMEGELPYYSSSRAMFEGMTEAEQQKIADDILESFGGQHEGTEKVLGYTCEKISVMGSLSWIYKGIILKLETKVMGIVANETATSFEKNISISASKFNAPAGVTFVDIEQQQQAMYRDMDMGTYEEEDDDEEEVIPVNYSLEDFKTVINSFNPDGYTRTMVMSQEGQHFAIYTGGGFTNVVSIVAASMDNAISEEEFNDFETFSHNGKTMRYGSLDDEDMDGKALIIPYKEHNMYIILMSVPGKDKSTLVNWADKLDF